jgi:hypothetical protein
MSKQRIVALLKKEFSQFFRDKALARIVILAPVLQLQFFLLMFLVDLAQFLLLFRELAAHFFHLCGGRIDIRLQELNPSLQKIMLLTS